MLLTTTTADTMLRGALAEGDLHGALDLIPAAVYITSPDGLVVWHNRACAAFAGRTPEIGRDRWCVTWKLRTLDGADLPHSECPMAVAVRERREVRGVTAIAERPDGSRARFMPFPTPLFDETGAFTGAVNLLLDLDIADQAADLRAQAQRCRRLAGALTAGDTGATLRRMADDYDAQARDIERPN